MSRTLNVWIEIILDLSFQCEITNGSLSSGGGYFLIFVMMKKVLRIMIEEFDYYVETEWRYEEFPKVDDFITIPIYCSDDDVKYFTDSPLPEYLHSDFDNILEFVKYYRWQVVERAWNLVDGMTINCRRVDPSLL